MAIYTRFGSEVELLTARLVPVWVERKRGEIKWHYSAPKPTRQTIKIEEMPMWFVTAKYTDEGLAGEMVCDGKLVNPATLKADGGSREIWERMHVLNPWDAAADEKWNKANGPRASELFATVQEKMVA